MWRQGWHWWNMKGYNYWGSFLFFLWGSGCPFMGRMPFFSKLFFLGSGLFVLGVSCLSILGFFFLEWHLFCLPLLLRYFLLLKGFCPFLIGFFFFIPLMILPSTLRLPSSSLPLMVMVWFFMFIAWLFFHHRLWARWGPTWRLLLWMWVIFTTRHGMSPKPILSFLCFSCK